MIQRVSDTEFHVDRALLDRDITEFVQSARIIPEQREGEVVGVRLFGIRRNTLLGSLGLRNGDRLESINGTPITAPEQATQMLAQFRSAASLQVAVARRGEPVQIDYHIK
jgi:general secretion pathway protein C